MQYCVCLRHQWERDASELRRWDPRSPDHVGNNDIITNLGDGLDRSNVHHSVSAHDASQYHDHGLPYWTTSLDRVSG